MKKILSFMLVMALCLTMCLTFAACGGEGDETDDSGDQGVIDSLVLKTKLTMLSGKVDDIKTQYGQEILLMGLTEIFNAETVLASSDENVMMLTLSSYIHRNECEHNVEDLKWMYTNDSYHTLRCFSDAEEHNGCDTNIVYNEPHNTINSSYCSFCGQSNSPLKPLYESDVAEIPGGRTMNDTGCISNAKRYERFSTLYHKVTCRDCEMIGWWPHVIENNFCTLCGEMFNILPDPVADTPDDTTAAPEDTTVPSDTTDIPPVTGNETDAAEDTTIPSDETTGSVEETTPVDGEVTTAPEDSTEEEEPVVDPTVKDLIAMIDNDVNYQYINQLVINILEIEALDADLEVLCFEAVTKTMSIENFAILYTVVETAIQNEKLEPEYQAFIWDEEHFDVGLVTEFAINRITKVQTSANKALIQEYIASVSE